MLVKEKKGSSLSIVLTGCLALLYMVISILVGEVLKLPLTLHKSLLLIKCLPYISVVSFLGIVFWRRKVSVLSYVFEAGLKRRSPAESSVVNGSS